jgi:tetratricopeptide (TPR) repeat protein
MLGLEPAISLGVLSTMTGTSPEALAPLVKRFIDRNIVVQSAGQLSLAAPLRDVVYRSYGLLSRTEFAQMAERLKQEYWSDASKVPPLDAVDATIYTVARGLPQQFAGFSDITMPSQLLNIAVKAYHEREWKIAQDFAVRAVAANAQPQRAFSTLCKASVRLAHEGLQEWAVAERRVAEAEKHHVKGHQYLRGFMEWKRNNLEAAVEAYGEAIKGGYRDVSVYRDRAHCLYRLHRFEEAEKDIAVALERYPRNNFVVDLAAAIAIARGQYGKAERLISELETIDVKENFHHRRASLRAARGQFEAALADSEVACQRVPPLHEILAQRIDLLIELGQHDRAGTEIEQLARDFGGRSFRNVQFGLRCKMSLRKGNWREAEAHYAHLQDTDLPVHRGLQIEILRQKVADHTVAPAEVEKAKIELENLRDLISLEGLWPSLAGPGDLDGPTGED